MLVTVFRSRLRPGSRDEYVALVDRMTEIARTMPGYISHKGFFADDGERVTIVEFEHEEGLRAWRLNPEHVAAQKAGAKEILYRLPCPSVHARPRIEVQGGRGGAQGRNNCARGAGLTSGLQRAI